MISIDTNILLYSYSAEAPQHGSAKAFIVSLSSSEDVAICEFVLTEFYLLLRNPAVFKNPLSASQAVAVVQTYRQHPRWKIFGFPPTSRELHDDLWQKASQTAFARRRIYDARTALCLRAFGVKHFATANVKDFEGFGFTKVWNPLDP